MSAPRSSPPILQVLAAKRARLEIRGRLLAAVRGWFASQGFLEVETPLLLPTIATEEHIEPFRVADGFLATSPELQMKELTAAGYERIFQITRSFRRGEIGRVHSPEFAILEWYRRGDCVHDLVHDLEGLFTWTARSLAVAAREPERAPALTWQGRAVDLSPPWPVTSVKDAFLRHARFDPTLDFDADRFDLALTQKVEPNLGRGRPEVLAFYPTPLGSLARPLPSDPAVCQRLELYIEGLELANGFVELNDPEEQERRFRKAAAAIRAQGREPPPMPDRFLSILPHLPDCVGIALGLDRMAMLFADAPTLSDVMAFGPHL